MRRTFLFAGAVVLAAMLLAVGNQSAPTVRADPGTVAFDISMSEVVSPGNANCTNDGDNAIDPGECPKVVTSLKMDTNGPGTQLDEPYFDLANTVWRVTGSQSSAGVDQDGDGSVDPGYRNIPTSGLRATPGALLNEGAIVGKIDFFIHSNLLLPAANNIDINDGQPRPPSTSIISPPKLVSTLNILAAETSTAILVSHTDVSPANGKADSQEDNLLANGNAGSNGIPDGSDVMPAPIPDLLNTLNLPAGAFEGRSFGLAEIANIVGNRVYVDVNFLVINLVPEGDGYLSYTLVQYTFTPTGNPAPLGGSKVLGQTVDTAPPFGSDVHIYAVTQLNNTKYLPAYTVNPNIAGGEISRQVVSGSSGSFDYIIYNSTDEDFDGDTIAAAYDLCDTDATVGRDAVDTDGDGTVGACDVNTEGTNPKTVAGHSTCPDADIDGLCDNNAYGGWNNLLSVGQDFDRDDPPGDWNGDGCAGICNIDDDGDTTIDEGNVNDDDEDGSVDENNFVGDGFLNAEDNCPALPDVNVDGVAGVDYQADSDGDGVGDPCDKAPNIPGDGRGYALVAPGTLFDWDRVCNDPFTIGAVEGTTGGVCNPLLDSNDDGVPDLADPDRDGGGPEAEEADFANHDNPDYDADTVIDADYTFTSTDYESDACEIWKGTDPLDPTSNSGTGSATKWDCDGDTTADKDDSTPFPRYPAFPAAAQGDFDKDGCSPQEELGTDITLGGKRDPSDPWDYYDVPLPVGAPGTGTKNMSIDLDDTFAVLAKFGSHPTNPPGAPLYDVAYDRSAPTGGSPGSTEWLTEDPQIDNNGVQLDEVFWNLKQFGHSCFPLP